MTDKTQAALDATKRLEDILFNCKEHTDFELKVLFETIRTALTEADEQRGLNAGMAKIYEEERAKYVGGVVYYPNNQEAFKGAMLKAIAKALTQITKPPENVTCGDVKEALNFIKSIQILNIFYKDKPSTEEQLRASISTLERATAKQSPDAELMEAARELLDFDDTNIICDVRGETGSWQSKELEEIIRKISVAARQAIARAEKGTSHD